MAATITMNGLASGLDSASIVSKLIELEKRPIGLLEDKQVKVNDQISAWQEFNTKLLSLNTSAAKLNTQGKFKGVSGTFTNDVANGPNIVSLTTTTAATEGTSNITVSNLAAQQKTISNQTWSSLTAFSGIGSLTITANGTSTTVTGATLDDYITAINNSGMGVTASVVDTSSTSTPSYKLSISGDSTGADNSFTITGTGTATGPGTMPDPTFSNTQTARNASITVDGLTVERATNTFQNVINGVTMTITGTGSGQLTFNADTSTIVNNVNDFIKNYNDAMDYINTQLSYDKSKPTEPLFGNSTLLTIQQSLRGIVSGPVSGLTADNNGGYNSLSQVGIKTDQSNHLTMDSAVFTTALQASATAVGNLFAPTASGTYTYVLAKGSAVGGQYDTRYTTDSNGNNVMQMRLQGSSGSWITLTQDGSFFDGPSGSDLEGFTMLTPSNLALGDTGTMSISVGIAEKLKYRTDYYTEHSAQGLIFNERTSLEQKDSNFQDEIDALSLRIKKKSDDLTAKYARLENLMAQLKGEGDYLTQQLNYLPSMSSTKRK